MSWPRFVLAAALFLILNGHILHDLSGRRLFFGQYQIALSIGACVAAWAALCIRKDRLTAAAFVGHALLFLAASWLAMPGFEILGDPSGAPGLRAIASRIAALYLGAGAMTIGLLTIVLIHARWRRGAAAPPDPQATDEPAEPVLTLIRMTLAAALLMIVSGQVLHAIVGGSVQARMLVAAVSIGLPAASWLLFEVTRRRGTLAMTGISLFWLAMLAAESLRKAPFIGDAPDGDLFILQRMDRGADTYDAIGAFLYAVAFLLLLRRSTWRRLRDRRRSAAAPRVRRAY